MNVVLYLRYSSDKQTEQSIEGQDRVCRDFCKREGHIVVDSYIDRATSAFKNTEARTAFQQMISDASTGKFDAIVVYKLDRFSRNRYDSAIYKSKLKKAGVKVISATEPVSDSPEGMILEAMLEAMAEYYSEELSQKIKRGIHESAVKRKHLGGWTPFGYRLVDHKLELDPVAAPMVRQAFEMYADGHQLKEIADLFNAKGIKTSRGADWNKCSFHSLLRNEKYIGVYNVAGEREEGIIPAIVDKPLFDRVQERITSMRHTPGVGRATVDYLLSGKVTCGHCGTTLTGMSGTGKTGKRHYYYGCSKHRHGNCPQRNIRKADLEEAVLSDAKQLITPDVIQKLADLCMAAVEEENKKNSDIPLIEAEIADKDTRINNLVALAEQGGDMSAFASRLNTLMGERKDALKRLEMAHKADIHFERDAVVWWLTSFLEGDISDVSFSRRIISLLINSITVTDVVDGYRVDIVYNTSDKHQTEESKKKLQLMTQQKSSTVNSLGSPIEIQANTAGVWLVSTKIYPRL